jgi:hypothetical protein
MTPPDEPSSAEIRAVVTDAKAHGDNCLTGDDVSWTPEDDRAKTEHRAREPFQPRHEQTQAESDREDFARWRNS